MSSQPLPGQLAAETRRAPVAGAMNVARGLLASLRPHQWVKNLLVFGGLIFSHSLFEWRNVALSFSAFVIFCLASSAIYLLNDLSDLRADRAHPLKRFRPLAAGLYSQNAARLMMVLLLVVASTMSLLFREKFSIVLGSYVLMNVGYSLGLKRVVILDVMMIALGFVLRAVAGAAIIGVSASPWLVLCTFMLALLMGFGKRRHELNLLQEEATNHRQTLQGYSLQFLDLMMTITGGAAVVCYALYTMADETTVRFGTQSLVLTVPFVLYGIFRYLFLVHKRMEGGDPARLVVSDLPTLINVALWVGAVCLIVYGPSGWRPW